MPSCTPGLIHCTSAKLEQQAVFRALRLSAHDDTTQQLGIILQAQCTDQMYKCRQRYTSMNSPLTSVQPLLDWHFNATLSSAIPNCQMAKLKY